MTINTKARIIADDKRAFLSAELDDPSLAEPIRAALFENGDGAGGLRLEQAGGRRLEQKVRNSVSPQEVQRLIGP